MKEGNTQNDILNKSGFIFSFELQHAEVFLRDWRVLLSCVRNGINNGISEITVYWFKILP